MLPNHTKLTKYIFIAFIIVLLGYAYFEAQNILFGPQINLGSNSTITVQDQKIKITGTVKNVTSLTLDGRPLLIDESGAFTDTLILAKGANTFVFNAQDKFTNTTSNTLRVYYQPNTTPQQNTDVPVSI